MRKTSIIINLILPVFLTIALFVFVIHFVILPTIKTQMMNKKREMIMELTNSAWAILEDYEIKVQGGELSLDEAQEIAAKIITDIRYGPENKDYFWINDMRPFMISHPYRSDLDGTDISTFEDPNGKKLFVEFVKTVEANGSGYVDYMWQWKDDPNQIVPKISYVRGFEPWGWIIGTGIYVEDVQEEIDRITKILVKIYLAILGIMIVLSGVIIRQYIATDRKKEIAEDELKASMTLYSTLVENVTDLVFLLDNRGRVIFANSYVCDHFNLEPRNVAGIPLCFFWCGDSIEVVENAVSLAVGEKRNISIDCICENNYYLLSIIPLSSASGEEMKMICVARDITEQKHSEQALRKSEERYRTLIHNAGQGIAVVQDNMLKLANPKAMEIMGYDEHELDKVDLVSFYRNSDEGEANLARLNRRLEGAKFSPDSVLKIVDKDGNDKWIENNAILFEWEGNPAVLNFFSDITEKILSEKTLRENEERYRSLFETAGEGILIMNGDTFIDCNSKIQEMFRCAREDIIGKTSKDFSPEIQPEGILTSEKEIQKLNVAYKGKTQSFEWRHRRGDGTEFDAEVTLSRFHIDEEPHLLAIIRDISDRKIAEEKLWESKRRYKSIVEDQTEFIVRWKPDGTITFANAAYCRYLGTDSDDITGKNFRTLISNEKGIIDQDPASLLTVEKPVVKTERQVQTPDGAIVWQMWIDRALFNEDGKIIEMQSVGNDITEQKAAKEEKKDLEKQLMHSQKMEAIGQLAGGVAHDFNNMLAVILGSAELLKSCIDTQDEAYEELRAVTQSVERAKDLTFKLLTFARKEKIKVENTRVNDILNNVAGILERTIDKKISIKTSIQDTALISCDANQITQALINISNNAADAMPDGGQLTIESNVMEFVDNKCSVCGAEMHGRFCNIMVTDTGQGISKENLDKIIEPFFTTKGVGKGTGLGLSITQGIITNHNGHMHIYSEVGVGTCVKIYLPLVDEKVVVDGHKAAVQDYRGTGTVLIVDDEDMLLVIAGKLLDRAGYETILAGKGKEAIEIYKAEKDRIDVVILDMVMPDMDGRQVWHELKKIDPDVSVVLSSGYSIDGHAGELMKDGVKGFVQKPFEKDELLKAVYELIEKK